MHCVNYAHRGASEYAPENTLPAFYLGLAMGADGIETDIQRTRDGVLVLHHDQTLERVTCTSGTIQDYTYGELLAMDFAAHRKGSPYRPERIVTLDDFLRYFGSKPLHLALEIKQEGIAAEITRAVSAHVSWERVTLTSFSWDALVDAHAAAPEAPLGFLSRDAVSETLLDAMEKAGMRQICPPAPLLDVKGVALARSRGFSVRAWGVKTPELMNAMLDLDIDGMTVNFPDKLTEALRARGL